MQWTNEANRVAKRVRKVIEERSFTYRYYNGDYRDFRARIEQRAEQLRAKEVDEAIVTQNAMAWGLIEQ